MIGARRALKLANGILRRVGVQVVRTTREQKPWDGEFAYWIAQAKALGLDPNDVGDREWRGRGSEEAEGRIAILEASGAP